VRWYLRYKLSLRDLVRSNVPILKAQGIARDSIMQK
jgi:hypothetical protein